VLALLDVDGTLLLGAPWAHTIALVEAMGDVFGVSAEPADIRAVRPAGRTDREIARLVLRARGVDDATVDAGLAEWAARAAVIHARIAPDHPDPAVAPGAPEALARLSAAGLTAGLLTGNLEPIAWAKMARAGLAPLLARGQGAFGSDHEDREALVAIARRRAALGERDLVVVVGDTPRDIACARAGGARSVAVATGPHPAAALGAADVVVPDLAAAAEAVLALGAAYGGESAAATRRS
jgi:phosphoglycolate phosphatase-like HAD superfamily hydrolase